MVLAIHIPSISIKLDICQEVSPAPPVIRREKFAWRRTPAKLQRFTAANQYLPEWVSIWVARSPRNSQKRLEPEIQKIDLPGYEFEGSSYQPLCSRLHVAGSRDFILIDVDYHPGCKIEHPFRNHPTACIYPDPPEKFSVTSPSEFERSGVSGTGGRSWGKPWHAVLQSGFNPLRTPWTASKAID